MSSLAPEHAVIVTSEQAEMFADEWFEESYNTSVVFEACRLTGVTDHIVDVNEKRRFERAVCMRMFELAKNAIVDAFTTAATDVLSR
jgi:hypothetical protein